MQTENTSAGAALSHLPGLDALRFFAASVVMIGHGHLSIQKLGLARASDVAFFYMGREAVDFFFTLSGFLITFLLLKERERSGGIDLRAFYMRRVLRIWPLYFLVLGIGFTVLGLLVPALLGQSYFKFPNVWAGLSLFLFFLPNLATALYPVGLLYPLWSIGVEEQFYLAWAPLFRALRRPWVAAIAAIVIFGGLSVANQLNWLGLERSGRAFVGTLSFHCMAIGALFAHWVFFGLHHYRQSIWAKPVVQAAVIGLIMAHFTVGLPFPLLALNDLVMSTLYGLLILLVSVNTRRIVQLEIEPFRYLGTISYGIYLLHMVIDYVLRFTFERVPLPLSSSILVPSYYIALSVLTIAAAAVSHRSFEAWFLRRKTSWSRA